MPLIARRIHAHLALVPIALLASGCAGKGESRPVVAIAGDHSVFGPGMEYQYAASVNGVPGAGVIWGLQEGAAAGSILADGKFTAGNSPGTFHVIAQTATDPVAADTVSLTIIGDPQPSFTTFPDSIDAMTGAAAPFSVVGATGMRNEWSIQGGAFFGEAPTDSGGAFTGLRTAEFAVVSLRSTNAVGRSATITDSARVLGDDRTLPDQTYALAISPENVIASMWWMGQRVRFRSGATLAALRDVSLATTPIHGVFSADGAFFFVVLQTSRQVARIEVSSGVTTMVTIRHTPYNIARSEAGTAIFVTTADGWLLKLDAGTLATEDSLAIRGSSNGIAVRAGQLWVSTFAGRLYKVDPTTFAMMDSVLIGGTPQRIALNNDASRLYVANEGARSYNVVSTGTGAITTIPVNGGGEPIGVALSPDGAEVWFTVRTGERVDRYNAGTLAFLGSIPIGGSPRDIVFSEDGHMVLVGAEGHSMVIRR